MKLAEYRYPRKERGAALIIGLVMMLLLTMIGVSAMQGTGMQDKMTANMRDSEMAFQNSELALRYVERGFLQSLDNIEKGNTWAGCTSSCRIINSEENSAVNVRDMLFNSPADWDARAIDYGDFKNMANAVISPVSDQTDFDRMGLKAKPKVLVEYVAFTPFSADIGDGEQPGLDYYRVTSKAAGGTDVSESILQTLFSRRFE